MINSNDSEKYYKTIFEHTGTATVIIEEDTTISLANTEFEKLSGYSREEIEGKKSWTEFVNPDDLEKMKKYHHLRRADSDSAPFIYDFRFIDREGDVKNIHLNIGMITGTKKSVASLLDITELKRSQEAIVVSEKKFRSTLDNLMEGCQIISPDWRYLYVNDAVAKQGHYKKEELLGHTMMEMYPDIENTELCKVLRRCMKERIVYHMNNKFVHPDGEVGWHELSIHPVPEGIFILSIDISERLKMQEEIKRSESKYHNLFDNAADGIFLMKDDHFIECNEKALEIYGVTRDQIIGQSPYKFSPELQSDGKKSKDRAIELIKKALEGYPQHFEWIHTRYDGTPFFAEVSLNRVNIEDESLIQAIVRDVTERKKAEKLEKENIKLQELDKLKSMFIASMSHELRTPLNSIIGFTGIMLQGMTGELTEEQEKQLSIVKNSANHLLALINDVIDISKIEADKVELFLEDFDLSQVLTEIKESFMDVVERKGLKISLAMPEHLPVYGDERRTRQIIMNLVSNAVKFTDKGDVTINVTENNGTIEVSVKDTGIGIKDGDQKKLFQAFSRIHVEDQPIVEGTGLGLYLSKKIADLLGGDIEAKSQFNVGSEFKFIFPVKYSKREVI